VQDYVTIYTVRHPAGADRLYIGHGEERGTELTPAEAREVIEHMQLVLGEIEGAR
jgi:hypothetical protein